MNEPRCSRYGMCLVGQWAGGGAGVIAGESPHELYGARQYREGPVLSFLWKKQNKMRSTSAVVTFQFLLAKDTSDTSPEGRGRGGRREQVFQPQWSLWKRPMTS